MANMNDVAREANVSRGTVSNYLNKNKVRPEAAKRIEAAIAKLHYVRNATARELRTQRSNYVVFIVPTVWTPFFAELTYDIQAALQALEYKMILCISNSNYDEEKEYVDMANEQKVAGIISISYSQLNDYVDPHMPLVSIEKEPTGHFPLVSSDNYAGGRMAAEELDRRGCKRLIFIGSKHLASDAMKARQAGFTDYCQELHRNFSIYHFASGRHIQDFRNEARDLLQQLRNGADAKNIGIATSTDEYALEIFRIAEDMKMSVPEHFQLIGFDGGKISANDRPFLSSIRQPVKQIAEAAVTEFNKLAENKTSVEVPRIMLPVSFYEGKTTKHIVSNQ
ncbi:LacI family DNA-binding transcriptional regulator [Lacticaseibacillus zeae]|uniref:LacI family DNA-binding transcriptional regulator n=1 Tax=Lacticaseibacillus zeae TaxID=57037 RepID=A0A5R8M2H3_LACZE|nr:LacI family DNA-binding transcriptional regulator [Lacticaseibacillus zeae]TLF42399.1 LacI family DNA-binding transcriptional regulator [Lacticaseibacillus zeae]